MKKRLLSLFLAWAVCLSMLPAVALAAGDTPIPPAKVLVNGIALTDGTYLAANDSTEAATAENNTTPTSYVAYYKSGVLYLNGLDLTITDQYKNGINWDYYDTATNKPLLTIELIGNNKIQSVDVAVNGSIGYPDIGPSLVIQGTGSLTAKGLYGIWVWHDITIKDSVTVRAEGTEGGIANNDKYGKIRIEDTANVTAIGGPYGSGYGAYGIGYSNDDENYKNETAPDIAHTATVVAQGITTSGVTGPYLAFRQLPTISGGSSHLTTENGYVGAVDSLNDYSGATYIKLSPTAPAHTHNNVTFNAWQSDNTLPNSGDYYLTKDVTLSSTWQPSDDVNLCLNGKTIKLNAKGNVIDVNSTKNQKTLNLYDNADNSGKITHGEGYIGRGVYVCSKSLYERGTFNMYGGNITGNTVNGAGGGVQVGGTFNMYGGKITKNSAQGEDTQGHGGGVVVLKYHVFNMYGGEISDNTSQDHGGGVDMDGNSTCTISGGTITRNTSKEGGGGVHLFSNATTIKGIVNITGNHKKGTLNEDGTVAPDTDNNVFCDSYFIKLDGLKEGSQIGANQNNNTGEFASNAKNGEEKYFTSDVGYKIIYKEDNKGKGYLSFSKNAPHQHNWKYETDGTDTIRATCSECNADGGSITVSAPTGTPTYDGTAKPATVSGSIEGVTASTISYTKNGNSVNKPIDAGTYIASITVGNATASVKYDIAKATPKITSWQGYPKGRLFNNQQVENPTSLTIGSDNSKSIPFDLSNIQFNWYNAVKNADNTYTKESKLESNPTDAGNYIIEAVFKATDNTNAASNELGLTIGKAQHANNGQSIAVPLDVYPASSEHNYEVDIAKALESIPHGGGLEPNTSYGDISTQSNLVESMAWNNGKLQVTMKPLANITGPNLGSITVNLSSKNYEVVPVVVNITLQPKTVKQDMEVTMTGWTYGDTPNTPLYEAAAGVKYQITYATKADGAELTQRPSDAGEYIVTVSYETDTEIHTGTAEFTINKATPNYTIPSGLTATYGQTLADVTLPAGWSWVNSSQSVGDASMTAKKFKARFTPTNTTNYETVSDIDVTVTVGKAAGSVTAPQAKQDLIYNGAEQALVSAGSSSTGTIKYYVENYSGTWSDTIPTATNAGDYIVHYMVQGDENHTDVAEQTITAKIAKVQITVPAADTRPYIYNGKAQTYTLATDVAYTVENNTRTDAGKQTVTVKLVDKNNTCWAVDGNDTTDKEYSFVIKPAVITVTPNALSKTVGASDPELTYACTSAVNGETPAFTGTLSRKTGEAVGTYAIEKGTLALKDNDKFKVSNYELKLSNTPVLFTINARSSSGGSSGGGGSSSGTKYTVTLPSKTTGGTVKSGTSSAASGSTVTITVTPDEGYKVDKVSVSDSKGNQLKVTDKGGNKYSFTMPSGKVTVTPTFSKIVQEPENSPFTDVSASDYYCDAVKWAVGKGITGGVSSDRFAPADGCTRAQIVTFMWRAAGSPEPKTLSTFTDVPADAYYAKAVAWAVENGITIGTTATTFSPDDICTRAHGVTFLYRAAKASAASGSTAFTDVDENAYYAKPVKWAVDNGITTGVTSELFAPNNRCTRAQIVTFLYRLYGSK